MRRTRPRRSLRCGRCASTPTILRSAPSSIPLGINEATLEVRWEDELEPGPIGEYIEVIDVDPASQCCYAPVDLNHPYILTRSGLTPSEASPQFHQQMVYAVSMKTIEYFEKALGRVALWAPREIEHRRKPSPGGPGSAASENGRRKRRAKEGA